MKEIKFLKIIIFFAILTFSCQSTKKNKSSLKRTVIKDSISLSGYLVFDNTKGTYLVSLKDLKNVKPTKKEIIKAIKKKITLF